MNYNKIILLILLNHTTSNLSQDFQNFQNFNEDKYLNFQNISKKKNINFNSVAGAENAKEELKEVVDFLKNPSNFTKLGAKLPKGILLYGEPGNGKTLLAKAIAGEANCSFLHASGSEFVEVFVGKGAARIRELFEKARKKAPCIIFIDEIDALASKRSNDINSKESNQTLNQLLSEMDGFESSEPIIVIGATNMLDLLDPAILRPGRFDRKVYVPYPNEPAREAILKIHSNNVPLDKTARLNQIAKETATYSGAELAAIINEAAISAAKNKQTIVTHLDLEEAKEKIKFGKIRADILQTQTLEEQKIIAYHEAGHAIVRLSLSNTSDSLQKITIIPRDRDLGKNYFLPKDSNILNISDIESETMILLAGRAAEQLVFKDITNNSKEDVKKASKLIEDLINIYGVSDKLGLFSYELETISLETANLIDQEKRRLMNEYYYKSLDILKSNQNKLIDLAENLIKHKTLYIDNINQIIG